MGKVNDQKFHGASHGWLGPVLLLGGLLCFWFVTARLGVAAPGPPPPPQPYGAWNPTGRSGAAPFQPYRAA